MAKLYLRLALVGGLVVAAAVAAGCGGGSPARTRVPAASPVEFETTSEAFAPGGEIPPVHTCDGENSSPPLSWPEPPPRALSFAVIMDDPDAPGGAFTHWLLYNLLNWTRDVPEALEKVKQPASGGFQGVNDFGDIGYGGPCPPPGESHRYRFTVYAVARLINLQPGASKEELQSAMAGQILGQAELVGTYARPAGP